jgi:hypothetical protein
LARKSGAQVEPAHLVPGLVQPGEQQHRQRGERGLGADGGQRREPVAHRHLHVEQQPGPGPPGDRRQGLVAVLGDLDGVPGVGEV